jgi:hypothetical protein
MLQFVTKGFPNIKYENMVEELRPYYRVRENLYFDSNGFLCRNGSFFVPKGFVKTYMQRLPYMHQAVPKMLARARSSLWSVWISNALYIDLPS